MAYTDTNSNKVLSTDIYEISDFIDQIRSNNITDLDETASMVGIFGYMNEIFGQTLQNTLIEVSESSNETIPIKQPRIYFGMDTNNAIVINSKKSELDYPTSDSNNENEFESLDEETKIVVERLCGYSLVSDEKEILDIISKNKIKI